MTGLREVWTKLADMFQETNNKNKILSDESDCSGLIIADPYIEQKMKRDELNAAECGQVRSEVAMVQRLTNYRK